jgi:ribosomal protein L11 methylase PrmA
LTLFSEGNQYEQALKILAIYANILAIILTIYFSNYFSNIIANILAILAIKKYLIFFPQRHFILEGVVVKTS